MFQLVTCLWMLGVEGGLAVSLSLRELWCPQLALRLRWSARGGLGGGSWLQKAILNLSCLLRLLTHQRWLSTGSSAPGPTLLPHLLPGAQRVPVPPLCCPHHCLPLQHRHGQEAHAVGLRLPNGHGGTQGSGWGGLGRNGRAGAADEQPDLCSPTRIYMLVPSAA